jgi:hypothetical protein
MSKKNEINNAYNLISGELVYLESKKWKSLPKYRNFFSFVVESNIKNQIINYNLSIDYQLTLYNLHKPVGNLRETSFLCIAHLMGSVCEALLKDLYFYKINKNSDKKFVNSFLKSYKAKKVNFSDLLGIFKDYLGENNFLYLDTIRKLRNTIHINMEKQFIDTLEDSGHIVNTKIKGFLENDYITKKDLNFQKLETDFYNFISDFSKYY